MTPDPAGADPDDAQAVAERCAKLMWEDDRASQALGMRLESVAPGRAVLSMTVRADMVNGHDIGHGGFTFALADSAFAFACNTYNRRTVAQHGTVTFLAPTRLGDELVAQAAERTRRGRTGIYDIAVRRGDEVVAEFRGQSRMLEGTFFPADSGEESGGPASDDSDAHGPAADGSARTDPPATGRRRRP